MLGANEFWLAVHELAEAYDAEGLTLDERTQNIIAEFEGLPLVARRELLQNLLRISACLPDLYLIVYARLNAAQPPSEARSTA